MAVGHSILVAALHMIRDGVDCAELGGDYFDRRCGTEAAIRRYLRQLAALGVNVTIDPAA